MNQPTSRNWDELVDRTAWSILCGVMAAFLLLPLFASIARGQPIEPPPEEVAFDLVGLAVSATVIALATEWLRTLVPAWRRGGGADPAALAAIDHIRSVMGPGPYPAEVATAIEVLRKLAVATGGPGELAKTGLRIVPVLLGVAAAFAGWAPPIGDGSNPEMFGGVGAGFVASLFGGQLMSAFRSRLPGAGAQRAGPADDEAAP